MSSQTPRNALVGFFFLVAIMLFVVTSVILSGAQDALQATDTYRVRFDLRPGAAGLSSGAPVNLGGQRVGRVSDIRIATDDLGRPEAIEAEVKIRQGLMLYENADFQLKSPLLGAGAVIDIVGIGAPREPGDQTPFQGQSDALEPGEVVQGRIAPPQLLEHAGFGPEQAEQVKWMIADAHSVMTRLDTILARVEPASAEITDSVQAAATDLRAITGDLRAQLDGWSGDISGVLNAASETTLSMQRAASTVEEQTESARVFLTSMREMLDTNRPRFDNIMVSADDVLTDLRDNIMPQLTEAAASGQDGADDLAAAAGQLRILIAEETPGLRRTLSSGRLAADQLKHATAEIRRSPWRLLQRPQTRELESELIYNSASLLAAAASDLRDASAALGNLPPDTATDDLRRLTDEVTEALRSYRDAETALMKRFVDDR